MRQAYIKTFTNYSDDMTKEELQNIIDAQQHQIDELKEKIQQMLQDPDNVIRESTLYQELRRENKSLKEDNAFYRTAVKTAEAGQARRQAQIDKLKAKCAVLVADNQALSVAHDTTYWAGMTEDSDSRSRRLERENDELMEQCATLRGKVESTDRYVKHLENQLNELLFELRPNEAPEQHPEAEPEKSRRVGRPRKASRRQIAEAKKWRKEGHSIREIARMTEEQWGSNNRWSVSYVQKIVGDVTTIKK